MSSITSHRHLAHSHTRRETIPTAPSFLSTAIPPGGDGRDRYRQRRFPRRANQRIDAVPIQDDTWSDDSHFSDFFNLHTSSTGTPGRLLPIMPESVPNATGRSHDH